MVKDTIKEVALILTASVILGAIMSFKDFSNFSMVLVSIIFFIILISLNFLVKKILAFNLEADIKTEFWSLYQYWFSKRSHFKKPVPMFWLPIFLAIFSLGMFKWLAILEFDIKPRLERVSRRHGLYRFTEITDWHVALIAGAGVIANVLLAVLAYTISGYFIGLEQYLEYFAKLNIYYAFWSLIPLGSLDGSKIFFGSRFLWITLAIITSIFFFYGITII